LDALLLHSRSGTEKFLTLFSFSSLWQNNKGMDSKTFFRELKRRNVYKVATAYVVIAWLLIEAVSVLLFGFEARRGIVTAMVIIVTLGFLLTLYISWAFEATPEGMKRTENVPPDVAATLPSWSPQKFAIFIIATALLAASLSVFDLVRSRPATTSPPPTVAP
jgi:adenylate cyclase